MAKAMSRPKRWMKCLSDGMSALQVERDRLEATEEHEAGAGEVKLTDTAAAVVEDTLSVCESIKEEWQEWYDSFPENAQGSGTYQKLGEAIELDTDFDADWTFDEAQEKLEELDGFDPPRGYGRD